MRRMHETEVVKIKETKGRHTRMMTRRGLTLKQQPAQGTITEYAATTVRSELETIEKPNLPITSTTADKHPFNRTWETLPADLVALNLRHAGALHANKVMVRPTANPPGAL